MRGGAGAEGVDGEGGVAGLAVKVRRKREVRG